MESNDDLTNQNLALGLAAASRVSDPCIALQRQIILINPIAMCGELVKSSNSYSFYVRFAIW
jgi:hypothetical protein